MTSRSHKTSRPSRNPSSATRSCMANTGIYGKSMMHWRPPKSLPSQKSQQRIATYWMVRTKRLHLLLLHVQAMDQRLSPWLWSPFWCGLPQPWTLLQQNYTGGCHHCRTVWLFAPTSPDRAHGCELPCILQSNCKLSNLNFVHLLLITFWSSLTT